MLPIYCCSDSSFDDAVGPGDLDVRAISNLGHFPSAHAGLWYERFFNQYGNDFVIQQNAKTDFLKTFFTDKSDTHHCGSVESIEHYTLRQQALVEARQGTTQAMQSSWHFVTGLGNPHPLENAMQWHPVLGTPYLPASGVKGVLRAWCELHELPREAMFTLFGSERKSTTSTDDDQRAGELIFFDALPIKRVKLVIDTMTPHMGKWYELGAEIPGMGATLPADWHAPIPVPFLVAKDVLLQFSIAPRFVNSESAALVAFAFEALHNVLFHLGAGAKTAAGYGHMQAPDESNRKIIDDFQKHLREKKRSDEERAIRAANSPTQQILYDLKKESELPGNQTPEKGGDFHTKVTNVLASASHWPVEDRHELAEFARSFLKKYSSKRRIKEARPLIGKLLL